jgi:valyl-tRNA synthetase
MLTPLLGDVAVAVHPDDPRYTKYHGKLLVHPFLPDREVRIITDDVLVDMNFGTGAVKITPAHDPNDFQCGQRHGLPQINIFNDDGLINENGGRFEGQKRFEVRAQLVEEMTAMGIFRGKAANKMTIGFCSRSKDVVEPVVRPQWWVDCKSMAQEAVAVVRSGELEIVPAMHKKTWYQWLEGDSRDWCISRQLWWGHRIPAYFVTVQVRHHCPFSRLILFLCFLLHNLLCPCSGSCSVPSSVS